MVVQMAGDQVFVYGALLAPNGAKITIEGRNGPVTVLFVDNALYVDGERVAEDGPLLKHVSIDALYVTDEQLHP